MERLTATIIMVSVRVAPSSRGVSLPNSRMLVVSLGTSKVATAVGTAVGGVGMPSKNGGAAVAVRTGTTCGTLVGVCVGATVIVGMGGVSVIVGLGPGVLVPDGVLLGSGVAVSSASASVSSGLDAVDSGSSSVAEADDLLSPTATALVGNGSWVLPQLARKMILRIMRMRTIGCLLFNVTIIITLWWGIKMDN